MCATNPWTYATDSPGLREQFSERWGLAEASDRANEVQILEGREVLPLQHFLRESQAKRLRSLTHNVQRNKYIWR